MATACAKICWPLFGMVAVQWFTAEIYKPHTKPTVCSFLLFGRHLHQIGTQKPVFCLILFLKLSGRYEEGVQR